MRTIVAASQNPHKIWEMERITEEFGMKIISRDAAGVEAFSIEEDGATYEENALKKAREIMKRCHQMTIADDSGVEVDALGGAPGLHAARYAGDEQDDKKNRDKLLEALKGVPPERRSARFVSVIALVYPDGKTFVARGEIEGHLLAEERGANGFGYDCLFVPDGYGQTFAEMAPAQKDAISHRAVALKNLRGLLQEAETCGT